jgi:hypothetical protein
LASESKIVEVTDVDDKRWKLMIVTLILVVIATVVTLSIVFSRERSSPTDPPNMNPNVIPNVTSAPTMIPTMTPTAPPTTSRFFIMCDVIASSFEDDFPNSTLQDSVLNWLADEDPASLAVDTNPTMLLERYIAALFYFAMQYDYECGWSDYPGWLSENPVCLWKGLNCTDQGLLATMELCTCFHSSFCL